MFSLICAWINGWVNNGEAGDLRRHLTPNYDGIVIIPVEQSQYHGCWCPGSLPWHQHPWYWLCRICRMLSYIWKDDNYLCHVNVGEGEKLGIYVYVSAEKKISTKRVNTPKWSNLVIHWVPIDPLCAGYHTCHFPSDGFRQIAWVNFESLEIKWSLETL